MARERAGVVLAVTALVLIATAIRWAFGSPGPAWWAASAGLVVFGAAIALAWTPAQPAPPDDDEDGTR